MKKNKLIGIFALLVMSVSLSGCAFLDFFKDLGTSLNDLIKDDGSGEPSQGNSNANFDVEKDEVTGKTILNYTYKDYGRYSVYPIDYTPSVGNPKLLIIPIWFRDSSNYISSLKKDSIRDDIRAAYLGTNSDTGWRSVKSYYEELSLQKVNISGVVSDWHSVDYTSTELGTNSGLTDYLVKDSVTWFFANNPSYSKKDFDSDNNGYLDGVMLIYGAPDYVSLDDENLSNLWAYCYWLQDVNENVNVPIPNVYFWASYDFMYSEGMYASSKTGKSRYGYGDTSNCKIDAHTYIHEMGHAFGLDDYYDYGPNDYIPAGRLTMQDSNVACHDPFSVMALGWANPLVVEDNAQVTIGAFQKTRDIVLISSNFNKIGSPFDEYLLLELYTPTGLNEFDCLHSYLGAYKGVNKVGIRVWHVDARLTPCNSTKKELIDGEYYDVPVFETNPSKLTADLTKGIYGVSQAFTNSSKSSYSSVLGEEFDKYNLLELIRNDTKEKYNSTSVFTASNLFVNGSYALSSYSSQFAETNKMNNGNYLPWNIKIEINGIGDDATANISIVK